MVIRVALVNDDEVVVRGLDSMLRNYSHRIEVVELVAGRHRQRAVDVALYDTFGMGQGNGPGVSRLLANPRIGKVVVYTWNFQPWLARETMEQGVSGYLSKSLTAGQLVDALQAVAAGRVIVSPPPRATASSAATGPVARRASPPARPRCCPSSRWA